MAARSLTAALIVTLGLSADGEARAHLQSRDPRGRIVVWVETVLTHELGHALGLADACDAAASLSRAGANKRARDCVTASPEVRASVVGGFADEIR